MDRPIRTDKDYRLPKGNIYDYVEDLEKYCNELERLNGEWKSICHRDTQAINKAIIYIAQKENKENATVRDWLLDKTDD